MGLKAMQVLWHPSPVPHRLTTTPGARYRPSPSTQANARPAALNTEQQDETFSSEPQGKPSPPAGDCWAPNPHSDPRGYFMTCTSCTKPHQIPCSPGTNLAPQRGERAPAEGTRRQGEDPGGEPQHPAGCKPNTNTGSSPTPRAGLSAPKAKAGE